MTIDPKNNYYCIPINQYAKIRKMLPTQQISSSWHLCIRPCLLFLRASSMSCIVLKVTPILVPSSQKQQDPVLAALQISFCATPLCPVLSQLVLWYQRTVVGSQPCQDNHWGSQSNKPYQAGNCLCMVVSCLGIIIGELQYNCIYSSAQYCVLKL